MVGKENKAYLVYKQNKTTKESSCHCTVLGSDKPFSPTQPLQRLLLNM